MFFFLVYGDEDHSPSSLEHEAELPENYHKVKQELDFLSNKLYKLLMSNRQKVERPSDDYGDSSERDERVLLNSLKNFHQDKRAFYMPRVGRSWKNQQDKRTFLKPRVGK